MSASWRDVLDGIGNEPAVVAYRKRLEDEQKDRENRAAEAERLRLAAADAAAEQALGRVLATLDDTVRILSVENVPAASDRMVACMVGIQNDEPDPADSSKPTRNPLPTPTSGPFDGLDQEVQVLLLALVPFIQDADDATRSMMQEWLEGLKQVRSTNQRDLLIKFFALIHEPNGYVLSDGTGGKPVPRDLDSNGKVIATRNSTPRPPTSRPTSTVAPTSAPPAPVSSPPSSAPPAPPVAATPVVMSAPPASVPTPPASGWWAPQPADNPTPITGAGTGAIPQPAPQPTAQGRATVVWTPAAPPRPVSPAGPVYPTSPAQPAPPARVVRPARPRRDESSEGVL